MVVIQVERNPRLAMGVKGRGFCKMSDFRKSFYKTARRWLKPSYVAPATSPARRDVVCARRGCGSRSTSRRRGQADDRARFDQHSTQVAKVGWKEWVALGDVPAFKQFFVDGAAAGKGARKAPYAGFWIRLAAYILDYVILTVVCLSALLIAGEIAFHLVTVVTPR